MHEVRKGFTFPTDFSENLTWNIVTQRCTKVIKHCACAVKWASLRRNLFRSGQTLSPARKCTMQINLWSSKSTLLSKLRLTSSTGADDRVVHTNGSLQWLEWHSNKTSYSFLPISSRQRFSHIDLHLPLASRAAHVKPQKPWSLEVYRVYRLQVGYPKYPKWEYLGQF